MANAFARTNGSGNHLVQGLDLSELRPIDVTAKRMDPWDLVSRLKYKNVPVQHFLAEDHLGDLLFKYLDKYNLLFRHVNREISFNGTHLQVRHYGGAKEIKAGPDRFLIYGGSIYRR